MKKKSKRVWIFALLFLLGGCSVPPYQGKDLLGADAFVLDSYKIKEGKFSILEMEGVPLMELDPTFLEEYKDRIGNGDVLQVALYHPSRSDLSRAVASIGNTIGYPIRDGTILLPDLPPIEISGLTLSEAQQKIQEAYDREIEDVQVFLSYQVRLERKVQLAGLVQQAILPVDGKIRLFEILSKAQVPPTANFFKSYLVRGEQPLPVDMHKLMKEGDMSQNLVMRGGDKIFIAEPLASTLMVMGEVRQERVINVPGGSISLREALALAGGIPYTGNKRCIQVIRGNILRPKIYTLSWKHVIHLPTTSLLLIPGDIVYVGATPLTEWNRFITQIFPTLTGIELFRKGVTGMVIVP